MNFQFGFDENYHNVTNMSLKNQHISIKNITLGLSVHRPEMIPWPNRLTKLLRL